MTKGKVVVKKTPSVGYLIIFGHHWSMLLVFSVVRVTHLLLLLCMYDLSLCSLCLSVFHVLSLSLDCILLITAITLVLLITLS